MAYPYGIDYQNPGDVAANKTGLPLTPGGIYSTAFKASLLMQINYTNFDNLIAGKGLQIPGILGVRSIAAGREAFQGIMGSNPIRWGMEKAIGSFGGIYASNIQTRKLEQVGQTLSRSKFAQGGLFGKGGLLGSWTGAETVSKIFGGGTVGKESLLTPFKERSTIREWIKAGVPKSARRESIAGLKRFDIGKISRIKQSNRSAIGQILKGSDKSLNKVAWKRLAGTAGKGLSIYLWASLGYDIGKFMARGAVNLMSTAANYMEQTAGQFANRTMEFQLGQGFYTGRAATERQRALQAIGQSGRNARGFSGNEVALQHVNSTW